MTLTPEDITRVINTYTEYRESLGETQALRATVAELASEYSESASEHIKELAECSRCGVIHLDEELYDSDDYLGDGSGRDAKVIDPSCERCIEAMHELRQEWDEYMDAAMQERREGGGV